MFHVTPLRFIAAREAAMSRKGGFQRLGLTPHPESYYADHARCYLTADDTCGFAVTGAGELVSLFNGGKAGQGRAAVRAATDMYSARSLWCFDGFLSKYYTALGFRECGRLSWDDALAPQGWDYAAFGRPDVVKMTWHGLCPFTWPSAEYHAWHECARRLHTVPVTYDPAHREAVVRRLVALRRVWAAQEHSRAVDAAGEAYGEP